MKKFGFAILLLPLLRHVLRCTTTGIAMLSLLTASSAWAGIEEGLTAYEKGDYPKALREF